MTEPSLGKRKRVAIPIVKTRSKSPPPSVEGSHIQLCGKSKVSPELCERVTNGPTQSAPTKPCVIQTHNPPLDPLE